MQRRYQLKAVLPWEAKGNKKSKTIIVRAKKQYGTSLASHICTIYFYGIFYCSVD